ncbi:hypothetical protein [Streptomyces albidoflavus]|uniref:hypothetical protein n=1 Tax=Streptomyces albidoflavus TaxID=1886 RepID=UPI001889F8D8|nr:hypothetical protein [Streptomyces albidoflavus]MBF4138121.1 hypothetical protein [Streptomyces albidoflavus]
MSDLDFYAHFATCGEVMGAGIDTQPSDWETKLGADYLDDKSYGLMRRDYGLVEVSFQEDEVNWPYFGISVQVHRLSRGDMATVPAPLRRQYGIFAPRMKFDELAAAITSLSHSIEREEEATTMDMRRYRVSGSGATIHVIAGVDPYGYAKATADCPIEHKVGDVWSISLSPAW